MFDKMIVSDAPGADSKGRSRYFIVSTTVVGILFLTAVVFSIYAAEFDLGTEGLELSVMMVPVDERPEPPKADQPHNTTTSQKSALPTRVQNVMRPDESPNVTPTEVSVVPSRFLSRPAGRYEISNIDTPGTGYVGERVRGNVVGTPTGVSDETGSSAVEPARIPPPPPVINRPKPVTMISGGVINGRATYLPPPPYPPSAKIVGVEGSVSVQVTIDESGKVVSAKAVDGHPLLRPAAEKSAWSAKFSPTKLSDVPVKVTGVIVYKFKKS